MECINQLRAIYFPFIHSDSVDSPRHLNRTELASLNTGECKDDSIEAFVRFRICL